jgi:hypothetical protein
MNSQTSKGVMSEKASAGWWDGMHSGFNPWLLLDTQYQVGVNITNRGGYLYTRPGYRVRLTLPSGNLQGIKIFKPTKDGAVARQTIVFAVDGKVYYSPFPLTQPANWESFRLKNINFNASAKRIYWEIAEKNVIASSTGELSIIPTYSVLMMQDGITAAAFWDGVENRHLNENGANSKETPIGTWMVWSGSRLWLARGSKILAGDLGDPLTFDERIAPTTSGDFTFSGEITGLARTIGDNRASNIVVFTLNDSAMLLTSITNRESWTSTQNFQTVLYPDLGCVAGKSIVNHAGLLWWVSPGGLVNTDSAAAAFLSSRIRYRDVEMARSKMNFAGDLSGICSASFENFLLVSTPSDDLLNAHTWAMDWAIANDIHREGQPAWSSIWKGTRPVEWANDNIDGAKRIFFGSIDYQELNGSFNHIWEAFMDDHTDSYEQAGALVQNKIYCEAEMKPLGDGLDMKRFRYLEADLVNIGGNVNFKASVAGTRGGYYTLMNRIIIATINNSAGSNKLDTLLGQGVSLRLQSRRVRSKEAPFDERVQNNVESIFQNTKDKMFSILFQWCGRCGIESYRFYLENISEPAVGTCEGDETGVRVVTEDGQTFLFDDANG